MNPLSQPVRDLSGVTSVSDLKSGSAVLSLLLVFCGYLAAGCRKAMHSPKPMKLNLFI